MSGHLSAAELADLIGCKENQRSAMSAWLSTNHWRYVLDRSGLPKVARAYYERKMGIADDPKGAKYDDAPNRQAFG